MIGRSLQRHGGRLLGDEQVAVATVLAEAISNYSEDTASNATYAADRTVLNGIQ